MRKLEVVLIPLVVLLLVLGALGCTKVYYAAPTPTPTPTPTPMPTPTPPPLKVLTISNAPTFLYLLPLLPTRFTQIDAASEGMSNEDIGLGPDFSEVQVFLSEQPYQMIYTFLTIQSESPAQRALTDAIFRDDSQIKSILEYGLQQGAQEYGVSDLSLADFQISHPDIGNAAASGSGNFQTSGIYIGFDVVFFRSNDTYIYLYSAYLSKESIVSLEQIATQLDSELLQYKAYPYQGGLDAYNTDQMTIQLATSAFYSDLHSGWKDLKGNDNPNDASAFSDNVWGRAAVDTVSGHYYPTAIAGVSKHILNLSTTRFDTMNPANPLVIGSDGIAATDAQIQSHAIWMGLLVHDRGTYTASGGTTDRWQVSPLVGDYALYLNEMPSSAMIYNGDTHTGTSGSYCWIVGKDGIVYGVYKASDGHWYSGFNGAYP